MPIDPRLIPTPQDPTSRLMARLADQEARLAALERNRKGAILDQYSMYGENPGWVSIAGSGQGLYVDAAQSKLLQWVYTPVVNAWVDVVAQGLFWNSGAASWNYCALFITCSPAPVSGLNPAGRIYDHSGASGGGATNTTTARYALLAGTQYSLYASTTNQGGNIFSAYQGSSFLFMHGTAWAR